MDTDAGIMALPGTNPVKKQIALNYYQGRIFGVDFSGAIDAGKRIWIADGIIEGNILRVEGCSRAKELPGAGYDRDSCLAALLRFIAGRKDCAFGLDFPFGLPQELVREKSWEEFIISFHEHYPGAGEFREQCIKAVSGHELKRITDKECKTPFSPYNHRIYRQTYFGISYILSPIVKKQMACVLPMQSALPDKPWILEICPASTLKKMNLYNKPYKGRIIEHHIARERILKAIEDNGVSIPEQELRMKILEDTGGDALDSIIAAYATAQALCNPAAIACRAYRAYMIEGYVFC